MTTKWRLVAITLIAAVGILFVKRNCFKNIKCSDLVSIRKGENIYNKNCLSCHGVNSSTKIYNLDNDSAYINNYIFKEQNNLHKKLLQNLKKEEINLLKEYIRFEKDNLIKP